MKSKTFTTTIVCLSVGCAVVCGFAVYVYTQSSKLEAAEHEYANAIDSEKDRLSQLHKKDNLEVERIKQEREKDLKAEIEESKRKAEAELEEAKKQQAQAEEERRQREASSLSWIYGKWTYSMYIYGKLYVTVVYIDENSIREYYNGKLVYSGSYSIYDGAIHYPDTWIGIDRNRRRLMASQTEYFSKG